MVAQKRAVGSQRTCLSQAQNSTLASANNTRFSELRGCQLTFELFSQLFELAIPARQVVFATGFTQKDYWNDLNLWFVVRIGFG